MMKTRGIWILETYAKRLTTFLVSNEVTLPRKTLMDSVTSGSCTERGFVRSCEWRSTSSRMGSFLIFVSQCGGLEKHGCCRVFRFLQEFPPWHDWVAFVDDDVYVSKCLPNHLPTVPTPLFAPAKHVGATGGWRWSLCGDAGRPETEIALPAGYGLANRAFVKRLHHSAQMMIKQCAATPSYNFDVAFSFISWRLGINMTAVFDWTDSRVFWMGGQRHLWRNDSYIFHKVRTKSDFQTLDALQVAICGAGSDDVKRLFAERYSQNGYTKTRHAQTPSLRYKPFDCQ